MDTLTITAPWGIVSPKNIDNFGLKLDFGREKSTLEVGQNEIVLSRDDYNGVIQQIQQNGLTSNIPITITTLSGTNLSYVLDLKTIRKNGYELSCGIKIDKGMQDFFDKVSGASFELIGKTNAFVPFRVSVPYLIERDITSVETFMLEMQLMGLVLEGFKATKELGQAVAWVTDVNIGTGVLAAIINATVVAIYLLVTIIRIIQVIKRLKEIYYPKLRYLWSCSDFQLLRVSCQFLGFNFQSSLIEGLKQVHTLPVPISRITKPSVLNNLFNDLPDFYNREYPSAQDSTPLVIDLINHYLNLYDAEIKVFNGVVRIETKAFFQQSSNNLIDVSKNLENDYSYSYNSNEFPKRKLLRHQTDFSDLHTADNFTDCITEYDFSGNIPQYSNTDGYEEINSLFALGKRKETYSLIENLMISVFGALDSIAGLFNSGGQNLSSNVINRKGVLLLSQEFFSVTKKLYLDPTTGKQYPDFKNVIGANAIFTNYHKLYPFVKIFENVELRLTSQQFEFLQSNNYVTDNLGNRIEIISAEMKDYQSIVVATLRIEDNSIPLPIKTKIY